MDPSLLANIIVQRTLPQETLTGLALGQYKLYGGVIRWAPGTENAGQIVKHIIPVAKKTFDSSFMGPISGTMNVVNTYQLNQISGQIKSLSEISQQVFNISRSTMVLSGLNLAVTAVGFLAITHKLNKLESKLSLMQKDIKSIKVLLELEERAKLVAVLKDLLHIPQVIDLDNKREILFNAKNTLAPISIKYRELFAKSETFESALAYEEYYCLTKLSHIRCIAELGMLNIAVNELREAKEFWSNQTRKIAKYSLLGYNPERFLYSDLAKNVPSSSLVAWLDFAYSKEKGYEWIDLLRESNKSWYGDPGKAAMKLTSSILENVSNYANGIRANGVGAVASPFWASESMSLKCKSVQEEREKTIPTLQRFTTRNNVLEGYLAQYQLMESNELTPSQLHKKLTQLGDTEESSEYLILSPSEN